MHVPLIPLRREPASQAAAEGPPVIAPPDSLRPQAFGELFDGWKDPRLAIFVSGSPNHSGAIVNVRTALRNPTVFRCVSLISYAIGMLPLHLLRGGDDFESDKAIDHPLYRVLHSQPNTWQSAFDFKSYMQKNVLVHGNAYALILRQNGAVRRLIPLNPVEVQIVLKDDWDIRYKFRNKEYPARDVLHVRGLADEDAIHGMSLVRQAAEAIGLANQMEAAAARTFRNGMLVGGALTHPGKLGPEALKHLQASLEARYSGVENAHRWLVLEEGMKAEKVAQTAEEAQHLEMRKHQIEELGRIFGVPRPLLGVDDTSWGTGIEQLGIGFVRYGLSPWFTAWEQAIGRTLLSDAERDELKPKFNEGALLRGSLKEQFEAFAKALGSGGHQPWMHVDEVRALLNLRQRDDLPPPSGMKVPGDRNDDPAQTA